VRISVVVPTYRRPDALSRCLDALARQDLLPDEVIVVARPDDKGGNECVRRRGEGRVKVIPVEVGPDRPGFVAALNAGIAASTGDVVCLTDDDAEPWPDWLARIAATFASDPAIGAVGGRDWVYHGDRFDGGEESVVGIVSWWGKVIGNHHKGVGPARDVSILKGVNLCARGDLLRRIGFDTRLLGVNTEHHSELGLCLAIRRMGQRVIYDPAIAVDHRPAPRTAESRVPGPRQVHDSAHNETLALLEHLSPLGKAMHLLWRVGVGSRDSPGLAHALRSLLTEGDPKPRLLVAGLEGRRRAIGTYLRDRSPAGAIDAPPLGSAVLAVAHSEAARVRAGQLLEGGASVVFKPGAGLGGMAAAAAAVLRSDASVIYLVDVGKTTAVAALVGRLVGKRVIVDTGDACFALARSKGDRSLLGTIVVGVAEQVALRSAHRIVVRGRAHAEYVPGDPVHIPDVAPPGAGPVSGDDVRRRLGIEGRFVVGIVGSLIHSPRLGVSYGWDLVEALPEVDENVIALVVGDGSGREGLQHRAEELGVADRCFFVGAVPSTAVSEYIAAMDVALSTQTNDVVGKVRTTGKLPLYLACRRPVLATHVGEAARVLGPSGWTIPYQGRFDPGYPARLAAVIEAWRVQPEELESRRATAARIAADEFSTDLMRQRLAELIEVELARTGNVRLRR
jgi:GT2 family glycosyltransferase/glycosyltransferase involved in cell wall biosynthesis